MAQKKKVNKKEAQLSSMLQEKMNMADKVLVITSTRGITEIIALKGMNYAVQAKGLLTDALDIYRNRTLVTLLQRHSTRVANRLIVNPKEKKVGNGKPKSN